MAMRHNIRYTPLVGEDDYDGREEDLRFAYQPRALDRVPWKSITLAMSLLALGSLLMFLAFFIFSGHVGESGPKLTGSSCSTFLLFLPGISLPMDQNWCKTSTSLARAPTTNNVHIVLGIKILC